MDPENGGTLVWEVIARMGSISGMRSRGNLLALFSALDPSRYLDVAEGVGELCGEEPE